MCVLTSRGELDQLRQHAFDRRAGQPVFAETVCGDLFELPELVEPLADRYQPTLHGLNVQLRMAGHCDSASS
jgi:hypothetical protein